MKTKVQARRVIEKLTGAQIFPVLNLCCQNCSYHLRHMGGNVYLHDPAMNFSCPNNGKTFKVTLPADFLIEET